MIAGAEAWSNPLHIFSLVIANFFRPVVHVYFSVTRAAFGLDAMPYYAAAILVHGLNGGVVAWAGARLTRDVGAGWLAGMIFVLHFTHFDAVYWLSAISDLLGTTATVVTLAYAAESVRGRPRCGWVALALTPLVLLCKESMVMLFPLLVWTVWMYAPDRLRIRTAVLWLAPAGVFWLGYLLLQRSFQAASPHVTSGYFSVGTHPPRMLVNAVANLLIPNRYVVPAPWWLVGAFAAFVLGAGRAAVSALRPGCGRAALYFLGWIFLAFFPCAFFKNYDRIPSRYSYLPSAAFAMAAAWLAVAWWRRVGNRRTSPGRIGLLVGALALAVLNVSYIWRIDTVRYDRHSRVSRAVAAVLQAGREGHTAETTLVLRNIPLPLAAQHVEAAASLYGAPYHRLVVLPTDDGPAPAPAGPVVDFTWDPAAERLMPTAPDEIAG